MKNLKEAAEKQNDEVRLTVDWGNPYYIVLTNKNGDTYTSKSEELMDFLHNAEDVQSSPIQPDTEAFIERLRIVTANGMRELTEERVIQAFEECVQKTPESVHEDKTCVENEEIGTRKSLQECLDELSQKKYGHKFVKSFFHDKEYKEAAELYAAQFKQPVEGKWISVETLPEEYKPVIIYNSFSGYYAVANLVGDQFYSKGQAKGNITHWMPLTPPKTDNPK